MLDVQLHATFHLRKDEHVTPEILKDEVKKLLLNNEQVTDADVSIGYIEYASNADVSVS